MSDKRIEAFKKVLAHYQADTYEYDEGEEEDPDLYLDGHEPIGAYVCVTMHAEKPFFLPTFGTLEDAVERCWEYATDDIFAESPLAVWFLDEVEPRCYLPDWDAIKAVPFVGVPTTETTTMGFRRAQS